MPTSECPPPISNQFFRDTLSYLAAEYLVYSPHHPTIVFLIPNHSGGTTIMQKDGLFSLESPLPPFCDTYHTCVFSCENSGTRSGRGFTELHSQHQPTRHVCGCDFVLMFCSRCFTTAGASTAPSSARRTWATRRKRAGECPAPSTRTTPFSSDSWPPTQRCAEQKGDHTALCPLTLPQPLALALILVPAPPPSSSLPAVLSDVACHGKRTHHT